jgi:DedD protein
MATRKSARSVGWLRATLGLSLLAIAGFAVGLFSGVLYEEPTVVASYLLGETSEVVFGAGDSAAELPPVAAETPAPNLPAPNLPAPTRTAAPAPAPAPVAAPMPSGRVAVQVGAFGDNAAAEKLAGRLRKRGFPVYVSPGTGDGSVRWRVRVGPLATREDAERAAARLKRDEGLPTWVLEEGGA